MHIIKPIYVPNDVFIVENVWFLSFFYCIYS